VTGARVEIEGLAWRPLGRRTPVLAGLELRLEPGERVLLAGPSGGGKSTLLRALAGQLSPDDGDLAGRVRVDGDTGLLLQDPTSAVVAELAGRDTAFGPENRALPRAQIWVRVREALRGSGFPYGTDRPTSALSGGEGQRLALAGALALRPGLMLLDEPTAMLDDAMAAQVRAAVLAAVAASGCTLVVVEHRMQPWLAHVDRLVVLSGTGEISADGRPEAVLAAHGAALAAAGLWVPGAGPGAPAAAGRGPAARPVGEVLLQARAAVARPVGWRSGAPAAAVGPLDAEVVAAGVTALRGPSGAGKSTLLGLLGGLSVPASGSVLAAPGFAVGSERRPHRWASRELARRVAWLPQLPEHALVARTVGEEVLATSRALGLREASRTDALVEALGLSTLRDRDPHTLSGGEQRRLGLAAALAHRPAVLLLDEPTVGQDRATWQAVVDTVAQAVDDGAAAVVASHDGDLLDALGPSRTVELGRASARVPVAAP